MAWPVIPTRLERFARDIRATVVTTDAGWEAELDLVGCWPVPSREVTFGKGDLAAATAGRKRDHAAASTAYQRRLSAPYRTAGTTGTGLP